MIVDHLGTSKGCFEAILSPFGPVLGAKKTPKARKLGPNKRPNGSKNAPKLFFSKVSLDHLGTSKKYFEVILSPFGRDWGPKKTPKALKLGPKKAGTNRPKGPKMGSKTAKNEFFQN